MIMKIKSKNQFMHGMFYTVEVEKTNGHGDCGFPTKITITSDGGGNLLIVNGESFESITIETRGEWESLTLEDAFEWIGQELRRLHKELEVV